MAAIANFVGVAAAVCSMTSFVPQIAKIWRERDASSVSLRMYVVTVTGFTLWIAYGALIGSWPVVGSNAVCLALSGAILALKWRFSRRRQRRAGASPSRRGGAKALAPDANQSKASE